MAARVAVRSTFVRTLMRTSTNSATAGFSASPNPSIRLNFRIRQIRISLPPSRLVRRELSSLLPVHSAIASACLVSKLPSQAITSTEGRFVNYLSPI